MNGQAINNPEVDFPETFGMADSSTRVRAAARWRIHPRHHPTFMGLDNSARRTKLLDKTVHRADHTCDVGAAATSKNKFKVGALACDHAFMRQPGYEVCASIGPATPTLAFSGLRLSNGLPTLTTMTMLAPMARAALTGRSVATRPSRR